MVVVKRKENAFEKLGFLGWIGVGAIVAVVIFLAGNPELAIMMATIMPGVYWAFAFIMGDGIELVQESVTCVVLLYFYTYCMKNVDDSIYLAPLSVGVHGIIDLLHHFHLYPSEDHVAACSPKYPLLCFTIDISLSVTLSVLLYLSGA